MDAEVSQAQVVSPITGKLESWVGLLSKSKYDGVGLRQPIDIALTLDISGSMYGHGIELAKEACLKLFNLLESTDHISFSTFDDQTHEIIPLIKPDEKDSSKWRIFAAFKDCYDSLKESTNFNTRVIMITDMEEDINENSLIQLMKQN